jgi:hypothetical protein
MTETATKTPATESAHAAATAKAEAIRVFLRPDLVCGCGSAFSTREVLKNANGSLSGEVRCKCMNSACPIKGREIVVEMSAVTARYVDAVSK